MSGLEFSHICKSFGAVQALRDVSVTIRPGEAHAIVGENGAGKSTLLRTLAGIVQPDSGEIRLDGRRLDLAAPRDALAYGIGLVCQETLAFQNLTAAANIFVGREITGRFGRLRSDAMRARAAELLARLHAPIAPDAPAESLSVAHRQLLQVARALAFECRVLALDEPTTALSDVETDHLFRILEQLRAEGVTLIYVSHRLREVFRLCNRITVLRDGCHTGTFDRSAVTEQEIVHAMVGRDIPTRPERAAGAADAPVRLAVRGLGRRSSFDDVTLTVRAGEIVGLFGLIGSGRSELLETIALVRRADRGDVSIDGTRLLATSPRGAARAGLVLVPEDRQQQSLFFNLSLRHNLVLPSAEASGAWLVRGAERAMVRRLLSRWRIKASSIDMTPDALSGGNQQKVAVSRWLAILPRVLLLDEPTKGVDVGAKFEIHEMIRDVVAQGAACLLVSSDLPEVLTLADRVLVMREGRLRGELSAAEADEARVMRLAATGPGAAA
ncbi:MAG: sugar ABC transporter ATP-binding protein [Betaproteobacteria bacterium]